MLIIAGDVSQNPNDDKQELKPALDAISTLPENLGAVNTL